LIRSAKSGACSAGRYRADTARTDGPPEAPANVGCVPASHVMQAQRPPRSGIPPSGFTLRPADLASARARQREMRVPDDCSRSRDLRSHGQGAGRQRPADRARDLIPACRGQRRCPTRASAGACSQIWQLRDAGLLPQSLELAAMSPAVDSITQARTHLASGTHSSCPGRISRITREWGERGSKSLRDDGR